jgi:hypothetical protein
VTPYKETIVELRPALTKKNYEMGTGVEESGLRPRGRKSAAAHGAPRSLRPPPDSLANSMPIHDDDTEGSSPGSPISQLLVCINCLR